MTTGSTNTFNFNDEAQELIKNLKNLNSTLYKMGSLAFGAMLTKSAISNLATKFFESDTLPVKIIYVDWWPRTKQQAHEFASKFWSHRAEGATASTIVGGALTIAWINSGMHGRAKDVWELAQRTTTSCLDFFGFEKNFFGNEYIALWALPAIAGVSTSLVLGTWELVSQYFDKDRILEKKPIFSLELQEELDEILAATIASKENHDFFQNILVYGPPGTGKTMISKWIAMNAKMNYIFMSGGDFLKGMNYSSSQMRSNQTPAGAAVEMLEKLVEHVKSLSTPTVIFVDEAEAAFEDREEAKKNGKSQELVSFLNKFNSLTGPSTKVMWMFATNRPTHLDQAVRSRIDHKIYIGPPELPERKEMARSNIHLIVPAKFQHHFTPVLIDHIGKQTKGFSGRDMFKFINRLYIEARTKNALEIGAIDRILKHFLRQEHQLEIIDHTENPLKKNPLYVAQETKAGPLPVGKGKKPFLRSLLN
jgi:ATPase family protein associated with various cellular activities (AAA)